MDLLLLMLLSFTVIVWPIRTLLTSYCLIFFCVMLLKDPKTIWRCRILLSITSKFWKQTADLVEMVKEKVYQHKMKFILDMLDTCIHRNLSETDVTGSHRIHFTLHAPFAVSRFIEGHNDLNSRRISLIEITSLR